MHLWPLKHAFFFFFWSTKTDICIQLETELITQLKAIKVKRKRNKNLYFILSFPDGSPVQFPHFQEVATSSPLITFSLQSPDTNKLLLHPPGTSSTVIDISLRFSIYSVTYFSSLGSPWHLYLTGHL